MALNSQWSNRLISDLMRDFPGLSLGAAQGIAGPFAMESKGFQDWQEDAPVVAGSRGGGGMAQWTGPRRRAYERYAERNGLVLDSYEAQYGYLREELKGVGGHDRGLIRKLTDVTDPYEAGRITTKEFLRPGIVNQAARNEWTTQVISAYAPLPDELRVPAGKVTKEGAVASEIDVIPDLMKIAPIPQMRPEKFSYAGNGAPIDSVTGLLMPRRDPRYEKATGRLNVGQGPDGVGLMPTMKGVERLASGGSDGNRFVPSYGIQARLPELAPPMNASMIQAIEAMKQEPKPRPGQTQIERNPPKAQPAPRADSVGSMPKMSEFDLVLSAGLQTEAQLEADAQAARDEILASEAAKLETRKPEKPRPGQSLIERTPNLPDVKAIVPTLPNGSQPKAVGFTYAQDPDSKPIKPGARVKNPAGKRDALLEDTTRAIVTVKDLGNDKKTAVKQGQVSMALPELPMESITSANKPVANGNTLGDSDSPDVFASMGKAVDDMFAGMLSGMTGGSSGESNRSGQHARIRTENNAAEGHGLHNYKPATGYGSRGYTSIESNTHKYDRDSNSWVEKPTSSEPDKKKNR